MGATWIVAGVSSILLVLSLGGDAFAWKSGWTLTLALLAVVFLALAVWQERRADEPIMPPHLFRNHTFVICGIAGLAVGIAMFGAMIFLPQYLQIVRGRSPMVSGLLTLPMMFGMIGAMTISGRIITKTGRYKIFPVVGLLVLAVGLVLMSQLHADTSMVVTGVYMAITGIGIGMSMQVLVLATQNAVDRADLGVATSGATFFRSMGGAIGVAMFGALLRHENASTIPDRIKEFKVPAEQLSGDNLSIGSPADVAQLPDALHNAVVNGFADSMQVVFFSAAPFAILGFIVVLFLREQRLDTRKAEVVEPAGVADASLDPLEAADSDGVPQTATALPLIALCRPPGSALDVDQRAQAALEVPLEVVGDDAARRLAEPRVDRLGGRPVAGQQRAEQLHGLGGRVRGAGDAAVAAEHAAGPALKLRCGPGAPQRAHASNVGAYPEIASERSRNESSTRPGSRSPDGEHAQPADEQQVLLDRGLLLLGDQPLRRLEHRGPGGVAAVVAWRSPRRTASASRPG